MKKYNTHLSWKKAISCMVVLVLALSVLAGCSTTEEKGPETIYEALATVQSVETSISLELHGSFSGSGGIGSEAHSASLRTDGTITATTTPYPEYHSEFYSSIMVDGATTRESREIYVVQEPDGYVSYEFMDSSDEWHRQNVSRSDSLTIPREIGLVYDWEEIMTLLTQTDTQVLADESELYIYTGDLPTSILQEFFGNNVFGSFMYSVEQLLEDKIPCTLVINGSTMLPESLEFTFEDCWTVSDMNFNVATATISYSNWNQIREVEPPKQATVGAIDTEKEFYSTYYAWNLFLPYIGGQVEEGVSAGNAGQSFSASWETYQVRIDGGMTQVPLKFEDLEKVGYDIDDQYASIIMEPNKYKEGVVVTKGNDKMICTFYNDDTVPQPIINCKVGCIDLSASNLPENGIQIYLPGEVTLGITKEALLSAYDDADSVVTAFSCDTYTWKGEGTMQSFMAEISPITGQVIRIQIKNIPVTGGSQI